MTSRLLLALGVLWTAGRALSAEPPAEPPARPVPEAAAAAAEPAMTPKPEPAKPAPADWTSRVELSGVAFLYYRLDLADGADLANAFDIGRMYFRADVRPLDHVKLRMTLDAPGREAVTSVRAGVTRVERDAGRFDVVLKHAYAELYDIPVKGLSVKLGMHDLPWVPFEEGFWGYRFQGTIFTDREGYLSSTDLGLGLSYVSPAKRLELHLSLINGETWSRPEATRHKDLHARVTVRPFAGQPGLISGLALNAFGAAGQYAAGANQSRHRAIGQLVLEQKQAMVAAELLWTQDPPSRLVSRHPSLAASTGGLVNGMGISAFAWIDLGMLGLPEGVKLMGRFDWMDPDTAQDQNGHVREILGIGYRASKNVELLLDADLVQNEPSAQAADERRLLLQAKVGF